MRYLAAAAWISVILLACGGREPIVGDDNNGGQRTGEDSQQSGEDGPRSEQDGQRTEEDSQPPGEDDQRTEEDSQQPEEGDRARLMEMRREIDAIIGDAAGASIADCRYAGLGSKPCGGPWEFIVYSVSSTDSTALARRLTAYDAFEAEMNERYGYVSDCSVPNIPVLVYRDGRCGTE